jgi:hypothetical protein
MATYENKKYLTLPQQVHKNKTDILEIQEKIADVGVGPQGPVGPQGAQGIQGATGPAETLDGINKTSVYDTIIAGKEAVQFTTAEILTSAHRFIAIGIYESAYDYFEMYEDGVLNTSVKISLIDAFILREVEGRFTIHYYDVDGNQMDYDLGPVSSTVEFAYSRSGTAYNFTLSEVIAGTTIGAKGDQGDTGPQGAQGIQGLPGEQNLALDDTYTDGESFPEYTSQIMIQIIGGDYDGLTFIKESLEEDDSVKFGPYATLITISDPGTGIQINLQSGVTSVKIYTMSNLT